MAGRLKDEPSNLKYCRISFPTPQILLVVISRPRSLNSLTVEASYEIDSVFRWFDKEPRLRVAVITGEGKAFCVGADLIEWMNNSRNGIRMDLPENGFAGLSLRHGKKPVIAAVNGPAYGGGCEAVVNCDLVVAASTATFALPEVKRGVTPFGGALPRLIRSAGRQRAAEMALTGRTITAQQFCEWGLCNLVVGEGESVVDKALEYAKMIAANSPDSVIVTREGLSMGWDGLGVADASRLFFQSMSSRLQGGGGENMQEGLDAFTEKRTPRWRDSKL